MTKLMLTDPASAIAVGRCQIARWRDPRTWATDDHPTRCGWCDYPGDQLLDMLRGYHERVDFDVRQGVDSMGAQAWSTLPPNAQIARIAVAQELVDEPPPAPGARPADPVEAVAPPAAHGQPATPPRPDWLGGPS